MIKVILFDVDGVLNYNQRKFSIILAEKYGISIEKTLPFFNGPFQDCLIGKADLREIISPYLKVWRWKKGVNALFKLWFESEHKVDEEIVNYVQELRNNGILCFIATNNEKYRLEYMLNEMGFIKSFDKIYASANLGSKKTDIEFFSKVFSELKNIQKKEILFIDDSIENVKVAKEFGFHAEIFISLENLKKTFLLLNKK